MSRTRLTSRRSRHNSERRHGLGPDVVAVEQEAGQVLHMVELPGQDLLGPLTHQAASRRPHLVLGAGRLTHGLHQLTLGTGAQTQSR